MVAPPLVPDVYQVTTFGTLNDMPCDHVINYYVPLGASTHSAIVNALATADTESFLPAMELDLPPWYVHTTSRCVYLGDLSVGDSVVDFGGHGTSPDSFGSHNTCWTVRHHVNVRGRGKQGRTNFFGPPPSFLDQPSGTINAGTLTRYAHDWATYQSNMASSMATLVGASITLVILDRKAGTYNIPTDSLIDLYPNAHRRWQKRLSRHR